MISFEEAIACIKANTLNLAVEEVPLAEAGGRILTAPLLADRNFPPFNRVTMDGIAIDSAVFHGGQRGFAIEGIQAAGAPPTELSDRLHCIEVMTGAVLPPGCDAVVPYEDCVVLDGIAEVRIAAIKSGQNIHPEGSDKRSGDMIIPGGTRINPAIIAIAATIGKSFLTVYKLPSIAVISTGDELVDIDEVPDAFRIRRSNSHMLAAALRNEGLTGELYHLPDDKAAMSERLYPLLPRYDALIFSGAVSKGRFDFLPDVLAEAGMQTVFHRVAQKPGKPMLFGTFPNGPFVFGLPGNPVSTLVCFHLFVKPWLFGCYKLAEVELTAMLGLAQFFTPPLTYHLPVNITVEGGSIIANPITANTSGDLASLAHTSAVLTLPANQSIFAKGEAFKLTWLQPSFVS